MISVSSPQEQLTQQIVLKHDTMPEYQTSKQTEQESVNGLGYIDKGTGKHQSNMVYDTNGLLPCEYAVQWKEPTKVVEWKKI